MWKKLQSLTAHPIVRFLKKLLGDPVQLYCIFLVMTVMQYYHADMNWLYTILSVFLSFVLMRFYDFVAGHKLLGPVCYLVFLSAGLFLTKQIIRFGALHYPIHFLVWFLTPQSVVDFSLWYTIAMYLLMLGFLSSAVYYFSKVRYRMLMQFVIMMIPLSLYAKEGLQMPALLVILLLSSYFLLMVYCRQIRYTEGIRYIHNTNSAVSVGSYVLAFSILAAVIPKPHITANRDFIENAMSYSSLSDVLMNAISMFTSVTNGGNAGSSSPRSLYTGEAVSSLRLRTQSYSYYSGIDDSWKAEDFYDYPTEDFEDMFLYSPKDLMTAICEAAAQDADFAETYGLEAFTDVQFPEQPELTFRITPRFQPSYLLPSPTRLSRLQTPWDERNFSSRQNTLSLSGDFTYRRNETVTMGYYPDSYAKNAEVSAFLSRLSADTYGMMLTEACEILSDDPETSDFLDDVWREHFRAEGYLSETQYNDWHSDRIDALAQEITQGLTSDYEKACAIERYFEEQGFVYDLQYEKAEGDNAETFLFTSRRGVCYEFATAMVLLCRSAGLPARYMQGYSMTEITKKGTPVSTYNIRVRDSHAFPEVYISGYGWLSFEPTVAAEEETSDTAENHYVMIWGFAIFGLAVLVLLGVKLAPGVRERLFRHRLSKMPPDKAASAIFRRMRRILGLPESVTVAELAKASEAFCGHEPLFTRLPASMDSLLYAPGSESAQTDALSRDYTTWLECRKAYLKACKAEQKRRKKESSK